MAFEYILEKSDYHTSQVQLEASSFLLLLLSAQNMDAFLNPLRAKFFRGNINIYLHFVLFLHINTTQVVEIFPQIRQEPTYLT